MTPTPLPTLSPDTQEFFNLILSSTTEKPNSIDEFKDYIAKDSEQSVIKDSSHLPLVEMKILAKAREKERLVAVAINLNAYQKLLPGIPRDRKAKEGE